MIITYILTIRILCNNQKLMNRLEYCNVQTKLCKINQKLNTPCLIPCVDDSSRFTIPDSTITEDISKSLQGCNDFPIGINPEKSWNNSIDIVEFAERGHDRKLVEQQTPFYSSIDTYIPKHQKYRETKTATIKRLQEIDRMHKHVSKSQTMKQDQRFQIQLNLRAASDFREISDSFNSSHKSRHMIESFHSLNTMRMQDNSVSSTALQDIAFSTDSHDGIPLEGPTFDGQSHSNPSRQHHPHNPASRQHHPLNLASHQHHSLISSLDPDPFSQASPQKHYTSAADTMEAALQNTEQLEKRHKSTVVLQRHSFSTDGLQKHSQGTDALQKHSLQKHSLSSDALQRHVLKDSLIKSCEQIEQEMDLCLKDAEQTSEQPANGDLDTSKKDFQCASIPHIIVPSFSSSSSVSSVHSVESRKKEEYAMMLKSEESTINSLTQGLYMYRLNYEEAATSDNESEPLVQTCDDGAQTHRTISLQTDASDNTELSSNQHQFKKAIKHILSKKTASNERKASKVLGIIFAVFVVLWTPFFTVNILTALCTPCQIGITQEMMSAFLWMGYVASLANPIVYTMFNTAFRKAFYKIITCKYRRSRLHTPDSMMMTYAATLPGDRRNTVTMYIKDDTRG